MTSASWSWYAWKSTSGDTGAKLAQLQQAGDLLKQGFLTEEEFQALKSQILDDSDDSDRSED